MTTTERPPLFAEANRTFWQLVYRALLMVARYIGAQYGWRLKERE